MIQTTISTLVDGRSLTFEGARDLMLSILGNEVTPAQFGALMIALRLKGETPEEMAGFASAMREKVTTVTLTQPVVDT